MGRGLSRALVDVRASSSRREGINLLPMDKALNRQGVATWDAMERELLTNLKDRPDADVRIVMDIAYPDGSKRPRAFFVQPTVEGVPQRMRAFRQ